MAVVEKFNEELMYGLSAKKVAIVERWALVRLYNVLTFVANKIMYPREKKYSVPQELTVVLQKVNTSFQHYLLSSFQKPNKT